MRRLQHQGVTIEAETSEVTEPTVETLYRRYSGWLAAALRRRFGPAMLERTEDLVQETYLRITPEQSARLRHPQAFLLRVAVNLAHDQSRRDRARVPIDGRSLVEAAETGVAADQAEALLLKQVILSLPPAYRDVFVLNRVAGMTYEQIARHCGLSVKTVEWRMTKALAHCARTLRD